MPEAFKNVFNPEFVQELIGRIKSCYSDFDEATFQALVFDDNWEARELKQRMRHISVCLRQSLPENLSAAYDIIHQVAINFGEKMDIAPMVFPDFVEHYGLEHTDSLNLLEHLTRHSSSEFAVRPFIIQDQDTVMSLMYDWAESDNYHVRRCASEGTRPRLPWAMALPALKKDPTPILPILEQLKDDPELYVRRSVANNLNDIAKDNPDIIISCAKAWLGQSKNIDWVVKHGCRTLLKQGHPEVLALFGFAPPEHLSVTDLKYDDSVSMGEALNFSFELISDATQPLGKLRLEFAIDFMKANGKQARKVFQISEGTVHEKRKSVTKTFSFKPITTRKYYKGEHGLAILVNGVEMTHSSFLLCS
ncbi:DNA alkylation repair protein [Alteromonas genovensis]|uniref:DNA alkylation repair protein n=1 Tax=Alteromonas genovensis TaxID=471225 RepID=UPI002FDF6F34